MNTIIEILIQDNQIIMIDTCFAMNDAFESFISNVELTLMTNRKKIVVRNYVMAELYRLMGSYDEHTKQKATRAVSTICLSPHIFAIDETHVTTETILKSFADAEFIADFTKNRIHHKMVLLTNDYKLGKDIYELNNLKSCNGKQIKVFRLTHNGKLKEQKYTSDESEKNNSIPTETETNINTYTPKLNWIPVAIGSVASFTVGAICTKYGKAMVNNIIRAIA